jgi:biotin carboxylase
VTVVGFSANGVFTPLVVTDRVVADPPAFGVALAHVWPSRVQGLSLDVAGAAAAALGIENGPSYTQLRIGPDGTRVVEVAARLGGGHDAELARAVTGIDVNGLAIDAALGNELVLSQDEPLVGGAVTRFLVAPPGLLEEVDVPELPDGVVRVRVYRRPGHVFTPLRRGADRAGAVLVTGDSREEALELADRFAATIRFRIGAGLAQVAD